MVFSQTNMRVLLANDHALFREGMKHMLTSLDEVGEIIEVNNYTEAIQILDQDEHFDVALVDLAMPGLDDFADCKRYTTSRVPPRLWSFQSWRAPATFIGLW